MHPLAIPANQTHSAQNSFLVKGFSNLTNSNVLEISANSTVILLDVYGVTLVAKQDGVSIFETIFALSIKVYPIPAKDMVNIVVPSNIKVEAIEVYNGLAVY